MTPSILLVARLFRGVLLWGLFALSSCTAEGASSRHAEEVLPARSRAISSFDATERWEAIQEMMQWPDLITSAPFIQMARSDPSPDNRRKAYEALYDPPSSQDQGGIFIMGQDDPDLSVRVAAARGMARQTDQRGLRWVLDHALGVSVSLSVDTKAFWVVALEHPRESMEFWLSRCEAREREEPSGWLLPVLRERWLIPVALPPSDRVHETPEALPGYAADEVGVEFATALIERDPTLGLRPDVISRMKIYKSYGMTNRIRYLATRSLFISGAL